jgi:hypothetical protein
LRRSAQETIPSIALGATGFPRLVVIVSIRDAARRYGTRKTREFIERALEAVST